MKKDKVTYFDYAQALMESNLSPTARLVGMVLGKRFYIKETAFPGNVRIGIDTGIKDRRTIVRAKKELREAGFLTWKRQGYNKTNAYFCFIPVRTLDVPTGTPVRTYDETTGTYIKCPSGTYSECPSNREEEEIRVERESTYAVVPTAETSMDDKEDDDCLSETVLPLPIASVAALALTTPVGTALSPLEEYRKQRHEEFQRRIQVDNPMAAIKSKRPAPVYEEVW